LLYCFLHHLVECSVLLKANTLALFDQILDEEALVGHPGKADPLQRVFSVYLKP
jgi:hypothetical protein